MPQVLFWRCHTSKQLIIDMKTIYLLMITGLVLMLASCSDDSTVPTPNPDQQKEEPEMGTLEKLAQTWVLAETYENGQQKTSGGTQEYMFTEEGGFFVGANGTWNAIGSFTFENSDSLYINMLFTGLNNPVIMQLKTLTETELKTEFVTGSSTLNYNYTR